MPLFVHSYSIFDKYSDQMKVAFTPAFEAGRREGASKEVSLVRWDGVTKIITDNMKEELNLQSIE
jgi:hypothetical protein